MGEVVAALADYADYPAEPSISTRYALLAAPPDGGTGHGDFTLIRDDQSFEEIAEGSLLRIASQPRPASTPR